MYLLAEVKGIEPLFSVLETAVFPLHQTSKKRMILLHTIKYRSKDIYG